MPEPRYHLVSPDSAGGGRKGCKARAVTDARLACHVHSMQKKRAPFACCCASICSKCSLSGTRNSGLCQLLTMGDIAVRGWDGVGGSVGGGGGEVEVGEEGVSQTMDG